MSQNTPSQTHGRIVLLLIAGIPVTMILAASWLWYFVVKGDLDIVGTLGTANHGELIQPPRQISDIPLRDAAGAPFSWQLMEPRWTMLVVNRGAVCDAACERRLYTTRQTHVALGRELNRVRRVMLTDMTADLVQVAPPEPTGGQPADAPSVALPAFVDAEHPGLTVVTATEADTLSIAPELVDDSAQWYLVDPAGWVMMRVADDLSYKSVIKDMKFLLKNSGG